MPKKYRLALRTSRLMHLVGATDDKTELPALLRAWFVNTGAGRAVYDDQVQHVTVYAYDAESDSYKRQWIAPADSRQAAQQKLTGFAQA